MTPDTVVWWAEVANRHMPHVGARILAADPTQRLELAELYLAKGMRVQPHLSQIQELIELLQAAMSPEQIEAHAPPKATKKRGKRKRKSEWPTAHEIKMITAANCMLSPPRLFPLDMTHEDGCTLSKIAHDARDLMLTQWGARIFRLAGSYRDEAELEALRFLRARAAILDVDPRPVSLLEAQLFLAGILAMIKGAR